MFIKKVSALLALGLCAATASANYLKTWDASAYAVTDYNNAVNKPLLLKPGTVYTINKGTDTSAIDYSMVVKCPQPKNGRMTKKGFLSYISFYYGYDEGGLEIYEAGSSDVQADMYSASGDPGYGSLLVMFCDNGKLTVNYNYAG